SLGLVIYDMILYIYGEDTYRSREYLRDSINQFKKQRDPKGYNTLILDGKKTPAGKIFAEINTVPFLAEKRMVVVDNLLSSSDKELLADFMGRLVEKKIPESTVLICWQGEAIGKVKEAKELHLLLQKEKYSREFLTLSGKSLTDWIEKEMQARGGQIENSAALELARNAAGDMWHLSTVINQLVAYASSPLFKEGSGGGRKITVADLSNFLNEKLDDNVFNLVDAVVSGNHKTAFKLLTEQRQRGEEDGKLFGLFLWQFRILLEMSDILEREGEMTSDELAKRIGIHPFVARKNLSIVRKYSLSKLESIYAQLLEVDLKTKTGQGGQSLLLDLFVAKV
ncbi:MAG: DNA polymerase III subunit delta, partial [Patescibacteria group bacterium]